MRRTPAIALLSLALSVTALPAAADSVDSAVAAVRGGGLAVQGDAEATANASASRQAANGSLSHASLDHLTSVCSRAAEIVGAGPSVDMIFAGFRSSANHMSKLTDPGWTSMGTGVATGADGKLYVAVVFCEGAGAPAPPAPTPTPAPAPAPAPAPRPAPTPTPSPPTRTPFAPPSQSTTTHPTPGANVPTPVGTLEMDIMGLITAVLGTSLDSLTAESSIDTHMASALQRFVRLDNGPILV